MKSLIVLFALLSLSHCLPLSEIHTVTVTRTGKPVKTVETHKERLQRKRLELPHPETNLVEEDSDYADHGGLLMSDELEAPGFDAFPLPDSSASVLLFPERADFVTGHRIPIELFGKETRERIAADDKYVDSSNFRRGGKVTTTTTTTEKVETTTTTTEAPAPKTRAEPFILEESLSSEDDKAYREHIHAFVDY